MKQNFFRKLNSYFIVVQQILIPVITLFLLMTFIRKQIKSCVYRDSYTQMFTIILFLHKWKIRNGSLKVNNLWMSKWLRSDNFSNQKYFSIWQGSRVEGRLNQVATAVSKFFQKCFLKIISGIILNLSCVRWHFHSFTQLISVAFTPHCSLLPPSSPYCYASFA